MTTPTVPDDEAVTAPLPIAGGPAPHRHGRQDRNEAAGRLPRRRPRVAAILVLASALLAIAGLVISTVVVVRGHSAAPTTPAATAPVAVAAAPEPISPSVAPGGAVPSRSAPGPSPTLLDESGSRLPTAAVPGIRAVFAALRAGDLATLKQRYSPSAEGDPWSLIAPRLRQASVRERLVAAMQSRPSRGEDVDIIYSAHSYDIGFTAQGGLRYIEAGQRSASSSDTASASSTAGSADSERPASGGGSSSKDPYGCLAADRAMDAGTISYAQHPCESHFQNSADPYQMEPDTPATRWALCHETPRADDPDYLRGGRARYCH